MRFIPVILILLMSRCCFIRCTKTIDCYTDPEVCAEHIKVKKKCRRYAILKVEPTKDEMKKRVKVRLYKF